ncbi:MAG TPA: hypothetical protein VIX60_03175 [Candidatus Cybelea sp.]
MQSSFGHNFVSGTIAVALLSACGGSGSGSGVPNAASSLATAQSPFGQKADGIGLSGEYVGKVQDTGHGTSRVKMLLSQSQNALGGIMLKGGSGPLVMIIAWNVNGHMVSGNGVGPPQGGGSGVCTFSMTGSYKYRRISGSYSATYGCTGQTGTFALWHKCYIPGTGSEAIRAENRMKPC